VQEASEQTYKQRLGAAYGKASEIATCQPRQAMGRLSKRENRLSSGTWKATWEGEIIRRSRIRPTGKTIDMPYDRLRGLNIVFDGGNKSLAIHSTTEYWTIGFPVSHSCIGMDIDDMLTLFYLLTDIPVYMRIT